MAYTGGQPPAPRPLATTAGVEPKVRPNYWAREGDHIQKKLLQSNDHLTAQSCRKEGVRDPKSSRCGSQPGGPHSEAPDLTCYGVRGVQSAACTWRAASPEPALGEPGSRGTAQGCGGPGDAAGPWRQPVSAPRVRRPAPSRDCSVAAQASAAAGRRGHVQPSLLGLACARSRRRLQMQ